MTVLLHKHIDEAHTRHMAGAASALERRHGHVSAARRRRHHQLRHDAPFEHALHRRVERRVQPAHGGIGVTACTSQAIGTVGTTSVIGTADR